MTNGEALTKIEKVELNLLGQIRPPNLAREDIMELCAVLRYLLERDDRGGRTFDGVPACN